MRKFGKYVALFFSVVIFIVYISGLVGDTMAKRYDVIVLDFANTRLIEPQKGVYVCPTNTRITIWLSGLRAGETYDATILEGSSRTPVNRHGIRDRSITLQSQTPQRTVVTIKKSWFFNKKILLKFIDPDPAASPPRGGGLFYMYFVYSYNK